MTTVQEYFDRVDHWDWSAENLRKPFESLIDKIAKKSHDDQAQSESDLRALKNDVQHFLRWALTGGRPGPTLLVTMELLGKEVSLSRIREVSTPSDASVQQGIMK